MKRLLALALASAGAWWLYLAMRDSNRVWIRMVPDRRPTPFIDNLRFKRS